MGSGNKQKKRDTMIFYSDFENNRPLRMEFKKDTTEFKKENMISLSHKNKYKS